MDRCLKYLTGKYLTSSLRLFGIAPENAEGSELLIAETFQTDPFWPDLHMKFPDRAVRLGDRSIVNIVFQSSPDFSDIFTLLTYHAMLTWKYSTEEGEWVPVSTLCVYPAGCAGLLHDSYPCGTRPGEASIFFKPRQIFLKNLVDMSKVVRRYGDRIGDRNPEPDCLPLTRDELVELFSAPLGHIPEDPVKTTGAYLRIGRVLSDKAGDPEILFTMLFAVISRGDIATPDMITKYREVCRNMGTDIFEAAEMLTGLNFPELQGQIESMEEKCSVMATNSVRALRGANFTAEEISGLLELDLSEVNGILKADGGGT
ncbi:MAG: hypothetical protein LBQ79_09995 [Deltaproteobacteria bacterium]|jgi:hypothetical protein|nr:hypothetical protein [Deltaproteobacteria bacterium]